MRPTPFLVLPVYVIKKGMLLVKGNGPGTICRVDNLSRARGIGGIEMSVFFVLIISAHQATQ
jgi:hypothetical protein